MMNLRKNVTKRWALSMAIVAVTLVGVAGLSTALAKSGPEETLAPSDIVHWSPTTAMAKLSVNADSQTTEAIAPATAEAVGEAVETVDEKAETKAETVDKDSTTEGEAIWTGWTWFESGAKSWKQVGGDAGNAYGRFQIDARHTLPAFLRYAAEADSDFVGLSKYYRKNGTSTTLRTLSGLDHDWTWLCAMYGEKFYQLQAEFAYGVFYCSMRDELLSEKQIDLSDYGPVLKGTVWSVSVRNGSNLSSIYSVTDTYYPGISEEEWLRKIYTVEAWRHPDQASRWEVEQLDAALEVLGKLADGEKVEIHDAFAEDAGQDTGRIELLTLKSDYRDFLRYTGKVVK